MIKSIIILHILLACLIITLILLNKGKGSEIGVTFGDVQEKLFGSQGSNSFLKKLIIICALFLLATNISMTLINKHSDNTKKNNIEDLSKYNSIVDDIPKKED